MRLLFERRNDTGTIFGMQLSINTSNRFHPLSKERLNLYAKFRDPGSRFFQRVFL